MPDNARGGRDAGEGMGKGRGGVGKEQASLSVLSAQCHALPAARTPMPDDARARRDCGEGMGKGMEEVGKREWPALCTRLRASVPCLLDNARAGRDWGEEKEGGKWEESEGLALCSQLSDQSCGPSMWLHSPAVAVPFLLQGRWMSPSHARVAAEGT